MNTIEIDIHSVPENKELQIDQSNSVVLMGAIYRREHVAMIYVVNPKADQYFEVRIKALSRENTYVKHTTKDLNSAINILTEFLTCEIGFPLVFKERNRDPEAN